MSIKFVNPSNLEIVLYPGNTSMALGDDKQLGKHTVCISGFIKDKIIAYDDDDYTKIIEYVMDIENLVWEPQFLQASTMTSWGEINSPDSDEVDHSRWGILNLKTGHTDMVVTGHPVRFLRLSIEVIIQGEYNQWRGIGFQTIANGNLYNLRDVFRFINETEEIKVPRK